VAKKSELAKPARKSATPPKKKPTVASTPAKAPASKTAKVPVKDAKVKDSKAKPPVPVKKAAEAKAEGKTGKQAPAPVPPAPADAASRTKPGTGKSAPAATAAKGGAPDARAAAGAKPASKPPAKPGSKVPSPAASGKKGAEAQAASPEGETPNRRFRTENFKDEQAAAMKLLAAAGLTSIRASQHHEDFADLESRQLTKSPFSKKELKEFREILLAKRSELAGDIESVETEALRGDGSGSLSHLPQHMADQGTDTFDQALALDIAATQRTLLREIDAALARIDEGTYGICERLGIAIDPERLRNTPWVRFSIEAAKRLERASNVN